MDEKGRSGQKGTSNRAVSEKKNRGRETLEKRLALAETGGKASETTVEKRREPEGFRKSPTIRRKGVWRCAAPPKIKTGRQGQKNRGWERIFEHPQLSSERVYR